jgi:hypothetical protein
MRVNRQVVVRLLVAPLGLTAVLPVGGGSTTVTAAVSTPAATGVDQIAYASASTYFGQQPQSSVIGVVGLDGSGAHTLSVQEPAAEPAWNPAGTLVAFTATYPDGGFGIKVFDPATNQERAITPEGFQTPVWSPDGTRIAVTSSLFLSQDLAVVAATGGTPKTVMDQRDLSFSTTGRPAWSPDGSRIAAALTSYEEGDQGSSMLATVGVDGSGYQQASVNSNGNNGVSPNFEQVAWSPDGDRLLFDGNTNGSDVNGTGEQVVQSIDAAGHGGVVTIFRADADIGGYAPDGSAVVAAVNGVIEVVPLSGAVASGPVNVVHTPPVGHADSRPIFAANGTKIVFCETDTAANTSDLYAVHTDGSGLLRLTSAGQACDPAVASHAPRFAGATRVDTAISASRATYSSAPAVVIARDDLFPDALAAAPLAGKVGGPLLLSPPSGLSSVLKAEVSRLGAKTAYVIGDTTALAARIDTDLRASGVTTIVRIGGATRYDTAAMIATRVGGTSAYIVRGDNWPDAASVSALAAFQHRAVLLTPQDSLSPAAATAIATLHVTTATIVGGTAAVGAAAASSLTTAGVIVTRIAGADRWATSAAVATAAVAAGMTGPPWLADGLNWPDAVGAGPAAGSARGVLLLVHPTTLTASPASATWLVQHPSQIVVAVGGPDVVSPADVVGARTG